MPPFLVKAKLKPDARAAFEEALASGEIAEGAPFQDALVDALRGAHGARDDIYFMLEARNDSLRDERHALEKYLTITSVLPITQSYDAGLDDEDA